MKLLLNLGLVGVLVTLAFALSLSPLTGCEQKQPSSAKGDTPQGAANGKTDGAEPAGASTSGPAAKRSYLIGVIAKSTTNAVFQAAHTGAEDAAKEYSKKYGVDIKVDIRTPTQEDAQKQAQVIEQLAALGADGIAISCTDGNVVQKPIDEAVTKGVTVVTFDSDSVNSRRMAYYGINDKDAGQAVMRELAKAIGDKGGRIAILGGTQTAPNLQARIQGVKLELEKFKDKGYSLKQVYYHKETPNDAVSMIQQVQNSNPDIVGWAMVGGWPLFTQNALTGIADKGVKVVAVDTLPEQLGYVKSGQVAALIGQDCYGWGHESVRMIVEKLIENKTPAKVVNNFDLKVVTKDNVAEVDGLWQKWLGKK